MASLEIAQEAVNRAKKDTTCTKWAPRSEEKENSEEVWEVTGDGEWKMHIDCAGFVWNVLETTMNKPFTVTLSDE
jgi:hypothetical protein